MRQTPNNYQKQGKDKARKQCHYCGSTHPARRCPAFGHRHNRCGFRNHFEAVWQFSQQSAKKKVQLLGTDEDDEDGIEEYLVVSTIHIGSTEDNWHETMLAGKTGVSLKLDTGAQVNVLPLQSLREATATNEVRIKPTNVVLTAFGDSKIKPLGTAVVPCKYKRSQWHVKLYITDGTNTPILGANTCEKMGLVKRVNALTRPMSRDVLLKKLSCLPETEPI